MIRTVYHFRFPRNRSMITVVPRLPSSEAFRTLTHRRKEQQFPRYEMQMQMEIQIQPRSKIHYMCRVNFSLLTSNNRFTLLQIQNSKCFIHQSALNHIKTAIPSTKSSNADQSPTV
ncbi:hypothetical protein Hanom_Chr14g01267991 [Helianthus anomalus]